MAKSHLVVSNERDMEVGIEYVTDLALLPGERKSLNISFPSAEMLDIFMSNLFQSFITNQVPRNNSLDLTLNCPKDD